MREVDRFKGCLIGGAVGDALGYEVEFMSARAIFQRYGKGGITEFELHNGVAEISDDTQMTLFTAAGLLEGGAGGEGPARRIARSYRDWYRTQTERYPLRDGRGSRLTELPELFSRRAPGNTCMSALAQGGNGSIEKPINDSKGCGGVMRVAPVGLYFCGTGRGAGEIDRVGAEAAALTHGHEMGYIPAAMLTHMIVRLVEHGEDIGEALRDAAGAMPGIFPGSRHLGGLLELLKRAADLSAERREDHEAIRALGEGWTGDEALAIAVYCAMKYRDDFERGVIAAVNHDGDSDSTGSIAGNLLGASLGLGAIPARFTDKLELRDVIERTGEELWGGAGENRGF